MTRTTAPVHAPSDQRRVCKYASLVMTQTTLRSRLFRNHKHKETIPTFNRSELVLGKLLGSGSFNDVYEVKTLDKSRLPQDQDYAIKFLKPCAFSNQDAAADLLLESKYLALLSTAKYSHDNIVKLHGISAAGCQGFMSPEGFFLILDRLQETLVDRMVQWKQLEDKCLFVERLQAGVHLSSALAHLHEMRIIFRDVKPENVGFDQNGVLKLFDFGLAKELDPRVQCNGGLFCMSGGTGSRRYMAPEVARGRPYGASADVYSFSVVLWTMLALDIVVTSAAQEPELLLDPTWPRALRELLEAGWSRNARKRPTMKQMQDSLTSLMQEMTLPAEVSSEEPFSDETSEE